MPKLSYFREGSDLVLTDLDITRPTTSSMTAALTRTEPTRVCARFTVLEADAITAKVVPVEWH